MTSRAKIVGLVVVAICVLGFVASRNTHSSYVDFALRAVNLALFVFLICYLCGSKIKAFFKGRSEGIAKEISSLEDAKTKAMHNMKQVEERIVNLEQERQAIIADYRAQGEAIKSEIIIKAEKTAKQIVSQAKMTAQTEVERAMEAMRAEMADEIAVAAQKLLAERLTPEEHEKLIAKSLTKVVLN